MIPAAVEVERASRKRSAFELAGGYEVEGCVDFEANETASVASFIDESVSYRTRLCFEKTLFSLFTHAMLSNNVRFWAS